MARSDPLTLLEHPEQRRRRWLPFALDPGRLLFALAIALVLYVFVLNETNPETTQRPDFEVPVEIVNVPPRLVMTGPSPRIQVRVRAPQDVFNRLRPTNFVAQIDASSAHEGGIDLPVNVRSDESLVREVTADPSRVTLTFEAVQERTLPVRVNLVGQLPSGYRAGDITTDPQRVTVSGATSVVNRAFEAVVDVNVDRVTVSVNGAFTPRVLDERQQEIKDLTVRPSSVNVTVPIAQQTQFKEVGVRPKITGAPAPGYIVEPVAVQPATVTLAGEPSALEGATVAETQSIDISGISSATVRRVGVVAPPNTVLLQPGQQVDVTIRVSPLTITQTLHVIPSVINIPPGKVLARQPDAVDVTISGPAPTLANLTAKDIRAVIDLKGFVGPRDQVDARVENLPAGMDVASVVPPAVLIELRDAPPPPTATPAVPTGSPVAIPTA
jgi:YbbR domain-containing protein